MQKYSGFVIYVFSKEKIIPLSSTNKLNKNQNMQIGGCESFFYSAPFKSEHLLKLLDRSRCYMFNGIDCNMFCLKKIYSNKKLTYTASKYIYKNKY